jgi:hypothetical protein
MSALLLRPPGTPSGLIVEDPHDVADGALVGFGNQKFSLGLIHPDGSLTSLITPPTGRSVGESAIDRSNFDTLTWVEYSGDLLDRTDYTLWTTPYASTEAAIQRRAVAKIPDDAINGGTRYVVNDGFALFVQNRQTALLIRLADGLGWEIPTDVNHVFMEPLFVDDNEIWLTTGRPVAIPEPDGMIRISRSTLGPPTRPRGF